MTGLESSRSAGCSPSIRSSAPSGYYAFKKRPASARSISDAELVVQIERVFWDRKLGRGISGVRKVWLLLRREEIVVARCTVDA